MCRPMASLIQQSDTNKNDEGFEPETISILGYYPDMYNYVN